MDTPARPSDDLPPHADAFGWGPASAVVDPERAERLRHFVRGSVLDVGCGTGIYVDVLARAGHDAVGLDRSGALIAFAREHRAGRFEVGNAEALPYADGTFDTVMALDLLEHVDDHAVLGELVRVARERVIAIVPLPTPEPLAATGLLYKHHEDPTHLRYYEPEDLEALVRAAGWQVEALEAIAKVDWNGLVLETVGHPRPSVRRWIHRALFKLMKHARVRTWHRELLVVATRK